MMRLTMQSLAWLALAAIIAATVAPIDYRPQDFLPVNVDRALAFAVLTGLFVCAYPRHAPLVGVVIVVGAGAIELLQVLTPSRHARFDDALVKAAGALTALIVSYGLRQLWDIAAASLPKKRVRARRRTAALLAPNREVFDALEGLSARAVQSKMIVAVYFSPEDGRLRIRMRNGEERLFDGVNSEVVDQLAAAPSPGRFYLEHIRPRFKRAA